LVSWLSGKTSVFRRRTFPVLCSTCSSRVTAYVGKPSRYNQANLAFHPFRVDRWVVRYNCMSPTSVMGGAIWAMQGARKGRHGVFESTAPINTCIDNNRIWLLHCALSLLSVCQSVCHLQKRLKRSRCRLHQRVVGPWKRLLHIADRFGRILYYVHSTQYTLLVQICLVQFCVYYHTAVWCTISEPDKNLTRFKNIIFVWT